MIPCGFQGRFYRETNPVNFILKGELNFTGVVTYDDVVDGSSPDRETTTVRIDSYETSVSVIPGLFCGRRGHR